MDYNDNILNKYRKKRLKAFIVLIGIAVVICVILGIVFIVSYRRPNDLREAVGTIEKVEQRDKEWYDYIDGGTGAYLRIWLKDGRYFEATGISYDNIDRTLFDNIGIGEEIKITYDPRFGGSNRIYAIEYNGIDYMLKDEVLDDFEDNAKTMTIVGACVIAISAVAGGVALSVLCCKYRKNCTRKI